MLVIFPGTYTGGVVSVSVHHTSRGIHDMFILLFVMLLSFLQSSFVSIKCDILTDLTMPIYRVPMN